MASQKKPNTTAKERTNNPISFLNKKKSEKKIPTATKYIKIIQKRINGNSELYDLIEKPLNNIQDRYSLLPKDQGRLVIIPLSDLSLIMKVVRASLEYWSGIIKKDEFGRVMNNFIDDKG